MSTKMHEGVFAVVDSFAIKSRNEFYLIGELSKGEIQVGWYVNITLNSSLDLSVQIKSIEDVDFSNNGGQYKLIIINSDLESTELLLGLSIGSENVFISLDGPTIP